MRYSRPGIVPCTRRQRALCVDPGVVARAPRVCVRSSDRLRQGIQMVWPIAAVTWLLFVLLGGAWVPATLAQSACATAMQDYRVAVQAYQDGLFDPAIAGLEAYMQQCPKGKQVPQAHYLLAEIFFKQHRFAPALEHAKVVIARVSQGTLRPHGLLVAAQSALQLKQPDVAQMYLRQVPATGVRGELRAAALYWLGEIAVQQQRYDEAQRSYQEVTQEEQAGSYPLQAHYALGWLARQRGDAPAALRAFAAFLRLSPDHELAPQVRFARAALFRETAQFDHAAMAFQHLAQEGPEAQRDEALFWWAEMAYQLGRYDEAWTAYLLLLTEYPQSVRATEGLYRAGWAAVKQQRCAAAVELWESLLQQEPQTARALEVHYQLALCYIQLEQYAAAREHLLWVSETEPDTAYHRDALLQLATFAFQAEDYAEAIQYYTRVLATAQQSEKFRLHYLLGVSYAALGEESQAIEHWQGVLDGPRTLAVYAPTLYRLGRFYLAQRAWVRAIPFLSQLWEEFPQFPYRANVALALVEAYRSARQCAVALPVYESIGNGTTQAVVRDAVMSAKAECLFQQDRYTEVVQMLAPLLAAEASGTLSPFVLYLSAQAYMQLEQFRPALVPFSLLQQRFPDSPLVVTMAPRFAFALEQVGSHDEALAVWQAYFRRGELPDEAERHRLGLHVGRLALRQGRLDEAFSFLAPAREAASAAVAAEALFWTGEVYRKQQQWELAQQLYQELLDRSGAEQQWGNLARLRLGALYERQQEWGQALQAYQALLDTAVDPDMVRRARQRIAAIEVGRVTPKTTPGGPSEG